MGKSVLELTRDLIAAEGKMHKALSRACGWMRRVQSARQVCRRLERRIETAVAAEEQEREAKRQARRSRQNRFPLSDSEYPVED